MNVNNEVIKQQCNAFIESGWLAEICYIQQNGMEPKVHLVSPKGKVYRFSDVDPSVIMSQLATLWVNTCKISNCQHQQNVKPFS